MRAMPLRLRALFMCRSLRGKLLLLTGVSYYLAASALAGTPSRAPTFAPPVTYSTGNGFAVTVTSADLNGDGILDLAVLNLCVYQQSVGCVGVGSVSVLLGNGDGTFHSATTYGSGGDPYSRSYSLAIADVNGDGKPDIVVTNSPLPGTQGYVGTVAVLLGNGDGTFQAAVSYSSGGSYASSLAIADINGDGKPDIVLANNYCFYLCVDGFVGVMLGNGDGTFQAAVSYYVGEYPVSAVILADVNGDGKLDLLEANQSCADNVCQVGGTVGVLLGNGDGTFQPVVSFPTTQSYGWLVASDVNHDGKPDLLLSGICNLGNLTPICGSPVSTVGVMLGNGDGTFQPVVNYATAGSATNSVGAADVNLDGVPDLVLTNPCSSTCPPDLTYLTVLLGNDDGTFQTALGFPQPSTSPVLFVTSADLNKDGKPDLVTANGGLNDVSVFINTSLAATATSIVSSLNPSSVGQSVTFTATVTAKLGGTPTGTVSFLDGNSTLGISPLSSGGTAVFSTSTLAEGTHTMTAVYNGDSSFAGSTSPVVSQVVQGAVATVAPTSVAFPSTPVGTASSPQTVTLTNSGNIVLTISSIGISGNNAADFTQSNNCGSALAVNASCSISVTFTPSAEGSRTGTLSISDTAAGSPQTVSLTGTGSGAVLSLTPPSLTFPSQYVGTSGLPQNVSLQNTGNTALTISNVTVSPSDYAETSGCTSSLAPGVSCTIAVFFDPTASGTRTGTLTVTDNAPGSPHTVALTGTGQDFSMAPSSSASATVAPGQMANYTISVSPGGGFNQTVTFACSGAPAQSSCTVSPSLIQLNGSSHATATVSVTTAGSMAARRQLDKRPGSDRLLASWAGLGLFGLVTLIAVPRKSGARRRGLVIGIALLCFITFGLAMFGCGGSSSSSTNGSSGTPAGTYNLTVAGTFASGSTKLTHNTDLTLIVQ
jgi:hypothetical protein